MQFALNKLRNAARVLLTLDEKDPKRIFEGEAIVRRMYRYGLLVRHKSRLPSRIETLRGIARRLRRAAWATTRAETRHCGFSRVQARG